MKKNELLLTLPSWFWLAVFFALPCIMVLYVSFHGSGPYGGIEPRWTWEAYRTLGGTDFTRVLMRTLVLSLLTTFICLCLALPSAYAMVHLPGRLQQTVLLLMILPFWTNFLIRIYAWKIILHPEGLVKSLLVSLHLLSPEASLLYTDGAVLLVLVYAYLPFALLPLYSGMEHYDFSLLEAAGDLGASGLSVFFRVFLPGIRKSLRAAILIVFVPALGSYIIPEIVGGSHSDMLGNRIARYVFVERNLPRAGALSGLMLLVILFPSCPFLFRPRKRSPLPGPGRLS